MPEKPEGAATPLDSTQQRLFNALRARGIAGLRILEIGCGVGRLHRRLIEEGAASAVGIELQARYIAKAEELARAERLEDQVTYHQDDFMALADRLEPADIVILDKVVHCTHDPEELIRESAAHTRSLLAIAFPARRPLLAASMRLLSPLLRLLLPFRVRFVPPETIRAWIRSHGFECVYQHGSEMWHTEVYAKQTSAPTNSADSSNKETP